MDEVAQVPVAALVKRRDFVLGGATIKPSLRTIDGPAGSAVIEPRVMQVLLALYDAKGEVLSRDDLLQKCWAGVIVGDDAINRTISEIRRALRESGAAVSIETIQRIGYRIDPGEGTGASSASVDDRDDRAIDRRKLLAGGTALAAILVGGTTLFLAGRSQSEIDVLIERGRVMQATGDPSSSAKAEALFRSAIKADNKRADAWGWLARVVDDQRMAREAALHALSLDPKEPNARSVLIHQRRDLEEWSKWEDDLHNVLTDDPENTYAQSILSFFYQGVGRCKDSWDLNERTIRLEPLNRQHQHKTALKHWIFGKTSDADKIVNQALRLWPRSANIWNARMVIYAFSDRAPAAMALLDDVPSRPPNLTQPSVDSWRAALRAIDTRAPSDIARAVDVLSSVAGLAPGLAANAIMVFSYLGEVDHAYRAADGLLFGQGNLVQQKGGTGIGDVYSGAAWGRTQFLFIPATAAFRADTRFQALCERTGHVAYWRKCGKWPDPFVRGSLTPG